MHSLRVLLADDHPGLAAAITAMTQILKHLPHVRVILPTNYGSTDVVSSVIAV